MKLSSFTTALASLTIVTGDLISSERRLEKERFSGLTHKPLGFSGLSKVLVVDNIGSSGQDGVKIVLKGGRVRGWESRQLRARPSDLDWSLSMKFQGKRDDQKVAPQLTIKEVRGGSTSNDYSLRYEASFGNSPYDVEVFKGTKLMGTFRASSGTPVTFSGNDLICEALGKQTSVNLGFCEWVVAPSFQQDPDSGACRFDIQENQIKTYEDAFGNELRGDRISLVERPRDTPGRAIFSLLKLTGTNLFNMTLDDERILKY